MIGDIAPKGAWYHVWLDVDLPHAQAAVDLVKLGEMLPHGSGLDDDWHVHVRKNGNVELWTEFHLMDENGFYCGWKRVSASLRRIRHDVLHPLLDGKRVQIIHRKGDVVLNTHGRGDLAEDVHERLAVALEELLDKIRPEILEVSP